MIREIIRVILQPFKAVWSIFYNDAHEIISKRGIEVLEKEKTKIDIIHDVSKCIDSYHNVYIAYDGECGACGSSEPHKI